MAVNDIMELRQRVDKQKLIRNIPEAFECIIVISELCSVLSKQYIQNSDLNVPYLCIKAIFTLM